MAAQSSYRPGQRIAMGGMAEVLLAHQRGLGGLEKLVVIKRILPHLESDPAFVAMFLEEAKLAARLSHPNIVDVIDVREEDDAHFIVMEYLAGVDLRELLRNMKSDALHVPIPVALRIIADAARGLDHAHRACDRDGTPLGIVHRDVTPSNIMVTFDGVTKVLDFGIAKASSSASLTLPGSVRGHFAYASPEQLQQEPLDARSDVYSLGVLLHELLTGVRLFEADTPAGVIQAVLERPIAPPSSLNPEVSPDLDEITLAALRRDRDQRPGWAGHLVDRLQQILPTYGTSMSQARLSKWLRAALPDVHKSRRALEHRAAQRARDAEEPLPTSSSVSVSSSISSDGEADATQITPFVGGPESSHSSAGAHPMPPPEPHEGQSLWLYALAASVATLAIIAAVGLAYSIGRSAG